MTAQQTAKSTQPEQVDPWAHVVLRPVVFHLEACQDCGAEVDQPCDDTCPSLIADYELELEDAEAAAEAQREYEAWGWAG